MRASLWSELSFQSETYGGLDISLVLLSRLDHFVLWFPLDKFFGLMYNV